MQYFYMHKLYKIYIFILILKKSIMIYSLPNGKFIEMSLEQYLTMSDYELDCLIGLNIGHVFDNPFHGSILSDTAITNEPIAESVNRTFINEYEPDLTELNSLEKLKDIDMYDEEEED